MSENKRREFWINQPGYDEENNQLTVACILDEYYPGMIHVIEYDASREKALSDLEQAAISALLQMKDSQARFNLSEALTNLDKVKK